MTAMQLRKVLLCEHDEGESLRLAALEEKRKALQLDVRQTNSDFLKAVDWALFRANGFGLKRLSRCDMLERFQR